MPKVKTKNRGTVDIPLEEIFESGANTLMYLLPATDRDRVRDGERHEGTVFHSFIISHDKGSGYSISIGKLPNDRMESLIV